MSSLGNAPLPLGPSPARNPEDPINEENAGVRPKLKRKRKRKRNTGMRGPFPPSSNAFEASIKPSEVYSPLAITTTVISLRAIELLIKHGVPRKPTKSGCILIPRWLLGHKEDPQHFERIPAVYESIACLRWLGLKRKTARIFMDEFNGGGTKGRPKWFRDRVIRRFMSFDPPKTVVGLPHGHRSKAMWWMDLTDGQKHKLMKFMGVNRAQRKFILETYSNSSRQKVFKVVATEFQVKFKALTQMEEEIGTVLLQTKGNMPAVGHVPLNMQAVPHSTTSPSSDESSSDATAESVAGHDGPEETHQPVTEESLRSHVFGSVTKWLNEQDIVDENSPAIVGQHSQDTVEDLPIDMLKHASSNTAEDTPQTIVEDDTDSRVEDNYTPDTSKDFEEESDEEFEEELQDTLEDSQDPSEQTSHQTTETSSQGILKGDTEYIDEEPSQITTEISSQGTLEESPEHIDEQPSESIVDVSSQGTLEELTQDEIDAPQSHPRLQVPVPPPALVLAPWAVPGWYNTHIFDPCDNDKCNAELPREKPCRCEYCGKWNFEFVSRYDKFTVDSE